MRYIMYFLYDDSLRSFKIILESDDLSSVGIIGFLLVLVIEIGPLCSISLRII